MSSASNPRPKIANRPGKQSAVTNLSRTVDAQRQALAKAALANQAAGKARPPQRRSASGSGGAKEPLSSDGYPNADGQQPAVAAASPTSSTREEAESASTGNRTPRGSGRSGGQGRQRTPRGSGESREDDEPEDNDQFLEDLNDLDELSVALGLREEDEAARRRAEEEEDRRLMRPFTGGTSTTESTAVPSTRIGGRVSELEDLDEASLASERSVAGPTGAQLAHQQLALGLTLPKGCRYTTSSLPSQLFLYVEVPEGPYMTTALQVWVKVFSDFPASGEFSVRLSPGSKIFHPNVNPETGEMANDSLLSNSYTGSAHLQEIACNVHRFLTYPVDSPALNADAAMLLQTDPEEFRRVVRRTLLGGEYNGAKYDAVPRVTPGRPSSSDSTKSSQTNRSAGGTPGNVPNKVRVAMMELENMSRKACELADCFQHQNQTEVLELELEQHRRMLASVSEE